MKKSLILLAVGFAAALAWGQSGSDWSPAPVVGGVGGAIVGGAANRLLSTDGSGNLQTDADTAFDGTGVTFTSGTLTTLNYGTGTGTTDTVTTMTATNIVSSGFTSTRVPFYNGTKLVDNSALTFTSGSGTLAATIFSGSGASLTAIPATQLSGVVPIANGGTSTGTALSGSGAIMVEDGSVIKQGAAGTSTTLLHGNASGTPTYSAVSLSADVTGTLSGSSVSGGTFGAVAATNLTSIPAGNLTGSVADARLSANVPLLNANNSFTQTMTGTVASGLQLTASGTNGLSTADASGIVNVIDTTALGAAQGARLTLSGTYTAGSQTAFAAIGGVKENASSGNFGGNLTFYTRTHGSGNWGNPRMLIDSTGNVGIGTSSPGALFNVVGDVKLSSMSVVDAYNTSFGSVTSGSTSTLTWTEVTDRTSEFVTSSFTATMAGYYEVHADASASQTAGTGCLLIKVNAVEPTGGESCITGGAALATVLDIPITRILNLSANDIVRIDGSATSANVTFQKMHLTIKRIP